MSMIPSTEFMILEHKSNDVEKMVGVLDYLTQQKYLLNHQYVIIGTHSFAKYCIHRHLLQSPIIKSHSNGRDSAVHTWIYRLWIISWYRYFCILLRVHDNIDSDMKKWYIDKQFSYSYKIQSKNSIVLLRHQFVNQFFDVVIIEFIRFFNMKEFPFWYLQLLLVRKSRIALY